ncbi:hypothetical protein BBK36DRAFT_1144418 [Trichoderma citrinoviride]|uniref:Secreted protein n=1 Tax=Trichoderma citrinoviride TaxID=58853 RepID=A0A2T4B0Q7_9HYPO|nr:hypothetical protein BBK36DRAFT_1144418 [Trichoderma citrinoviride]PTB62880.1 hypothetical protein BBK36DRAFT_1144418 [Trichoderma citrinoviride]
MLRLLSAFWYLSALFMSTSSPESMRMLGNLRKKCAALQGSRESWVCHRKQCFYFVQSAYKFECFGRVPADAVYEQIRFMARGELTICFVAIKVVHGVDAKHYFDHG